MAMEKLKNLLKLNQLVNIEITNTEGESTRYRSRIIDIDDQYVTLIAPRSEQEVIKLAPGKIMNIWFWNSEALYTFSSYLIKEESEDIINKICIAYPETIIRVQKRDYVRVPYDLDVLLSYNNNKGEEEFIRCRTKDISGGGLMLVINVYAPLHKGTIVNLQFKLDDELIKVKGEVVWNDWTLDKHGFEQNNIGVKFKNILESTRKIIIKNVFARQIELKRKGLL
jgi:c-di-GMP-binding flagellar brake protein YcgR